MGRFANTYRSSMMADLCSCKVWRSSSVHTISHPALRSSVWVMFGISILTVTFKYSYEILYFVQWKFIFWNATMQKRF